jgi:hypothetical protein
MAVALGSKASDNARMSSVKEYVGYAVNNPKL